MYTTINPYSFQFMAPQNMAQSQYMAPGISTPGGQFMPQQEAQITVAQVPTIDQVERVQMLPGERKIVLVQNDPNFLAIRVADNAGFVSTEYRTSQVIDPKTMNQQVQYAPVQAVVELKSEVDELKKMMGVSTNGKSVSDHAVGAE